MLKVILRNAGLLCLVLLSSITWAQDEKPVWETVVFVNGIPPSLVVLSSNESKTIPLPETLNNGEGKRFALSHDKQWLAYQTDFLIYGGEESIHLANLETGICCDDITPELITARGFEYEISTLTLLDFNPFDNSLLMATRGGCSFHECDGCIEVCQNNLILYNVETGRVDILPDATGGDGYYHPFRWLPEGTRYGQRTYCMPGETCTDVVVRGISHLFNPLTGEESGISPEIMNSLGNSIGDHLESTGEFISMFSQPLNPPDPFSPIYMPVVVYGSSEFIADGDNPLPLIYVSNAPSAYYADPFLYFTCVHWVIGGDAVLIGTEEAGTTLLMRDGTQYAVKVSGRQNFVAG